MTKPSATTSSTRRRRIVLVVAAVILGLVGGLVAMFEWGSPGQPVSEGVVPEREVSSQRARSPAKRTAMPQLAAPQEGPASAAPGERASGRNETKIVLTQIKVQKYVEEAYPAWLRAHPGQECPRKLIELSEYMEDKDIHDAWGRPLRMRCGTALRSGKGIRVMSLGRDGETSEDDIKFGD
jgi:hypothetical protein